MSQQQRKEQICQSYQRNKGEKYKDSPKQIPPTHTVGQLGQPANDDDVQADNENQALRQRQNHLTVGQMAKPQRWNHGVGSRVLS